MPTDAWNDLLAAAASRLQADHLLRRRRVVQPLDGMRVQLPDGRTLVNFASNDYLGLSRHPRVIDAARRAAEQYGVGSGSAPLVTGYTPAHASAEQAVARWKGTAAAVLFPSGFQANLALVQALAAAGRSASRPVRFLLDKLCHASLVDAARAADDPPAASFRVFPHNGVAKLGRLLAGDAVEGPVDGGRLDVILTESIFSMDGDAADLPAVVAAKRAVDPSPLLVVDEAHGSGVYGPAGAGLAAELGLSAAVDATVITCSKAAGVIGAAVCGSAELCEAVVNFGRGYVFSTSMPPMVAAAIEAAIDVMRDEPDRQSRVRSTARQFRANLTAAGFALPPGDSPIVPVILGDEQAALAAAAALAERGFLVPAIRPPTVPKGGSRLRITLSAAHGDEQVEQLLAAVKQACGEMRVPRGSAPGRPQ